MTSLACYLVTHQPTRTSNTSTWTAAPRKPAIMPPSMRHGTYKTLKHHWQSSFIGFALKTIPVLPLAHLTVLSAWPPTLRNLLRRWLSPTLLRHACVIYPSVLYQNRMPTMQQSTPLINLRTREPALRQSLTTLLHH
jgi:hypothetical protein